MTFKHRRLVNALSLTRVERVVLPDTDVSR